MAGKSIGFSADTAYDPELIEWLDQADVIVHEANYEKLCGPAHTPYEKLIESQGLQIFLHRIFSKLLILQEEVGEILLTACFWQ